MDNYRKLIVVQVLSCLFFGILVPAPFLRNEQMQIISGNYGECRLKSLAGANTRPTTGKVKESISNMIGPYFNRETVLDLFARSEGLVIEAVSRDCSHAICVDKDYQALKVIKEDIEITKEPERLTTIKLGADKTVERLATKEQQLDYLFPDPPYAKQKIIGRIHKMEKLGPSSRTAVIVCGMDKTVELPESVVGFRQIRRRIYGITTVAIYRKEGER